MTITFPGTTIETSTLQVGSSRALFDGLFAAGGISLSQVCVMTDLEPHVIQNWVKRGFLHAPVRRVYDREQFARILLIRMLREALQMEQICTLLSPFGVSMAETLYHIYVDMLAGGDICLEVPVSPERAAAAAERLAGAVPGDQKRLGGIVSILAYAAAACECKRRLMDVMAGLELRR